jgi:hypothetical protein
VTGRSQRAVLRVLHTEAGLLLTLCALPGRAREARVWLVLSGPLRPLRSESSLTSLTSLSSPEAMAWLISPYFSFPS